MPVFIFVSGLFAKRTVNEKRFDKMLGYILIYLILKLYIYAFKSALGRNPVFNVFVESGMPWFMLALFAFNLLTWTTLPQALFLHRAERHIQILPLLQG